MFDLGQQGENAVRTEGGPAASERALMRAVLEDAIRCLIGEVGPRHQRGALAVVAQTFGISISKASILSCGLASRMKAERDEEIRRLRAEGWTHRALAAHFELSRIRIMRICQRRTQDPSEGRTAA